jgi:hypothetical protein
MTKEIIPWTPVRTSPKADSVARRVPRMVSLISSFVPTSTSASTCKASGCQFTVPKAIAEGGGRVAGGGSRLYSQQGNKNNHVQWHVPHVTIFNLSFVWLFGSTVGPNKEMVRVTHLGQDIEGVRLRLLLPSERHYTKQLGLALHLQHHRQRNWWRA